MRKTLAAFALALFAVQAIGVYLLCACGSCPVSAALGVRDKAESEHACCAGHQEGDESAQGPLLRDHCGRCAHDLVPELAVANPRAPDAVTDLAHVGAVGDLPAAVDLARVCTCRSAATTARGPPDRAGLPPEIRFVRLLI